VVHFLHSLSNYYIFRTTCFHSSFKVKQKIMKKFLSSLMILPVLLAACGTDVAMDEFVQCLDEAGAEYYGAYWCPNCQRENELLGDSKQYLNYVECGEGVANSQTDVCLLEGIEAYPTWRFANGAELIGYQGLEDLAAASGCSLPGQADAAFGPAITETETLGDE
jgi:hypothetical protein